MTCAMPDSLPTMKTIKGLLFLFLLEPLLFSGTTRPLLPLAVPPAAVPLAPPADPNHFMFAVGGDNRATGRDVPMPPTARRIFAELRLLQPAFVFWTGDAIYGDDDTVGEARAEYAAFRAAASEADTPLFNAPGNHEINDRPDLEEVYQENMGRLYGSFDYGNSHFIALDTEEIGGNRGSVAPKRNGCRRTSKPTGRRPTFLSSCITRPSR